MNLKEAYLGALVVAAGLGLAFAPPFFVGVVFAKFITMGSAWILLAWLLSPLQWWAVVNFMAKIGGREVDDGDHVVALLVVVLSILPFYAGLGTSWSL